MSCDVDLTHGWVEEDVGIRAQRVVASLNDTRHLDDVVEECKELGCGYWGDWWEVAKMQMIQEEGGEVDQVDVEEVVDGCRGKKKRMATGCERLFMNDRVVGATEEVTKRRIAKRWRAVTLWKESPCQIGYGVAQVKSE
jgi:hypothetical protein